MLPESKRSQIRAIELAAQTLPDRAQGHRRDVALFAIGAQVGALQIGPAAGLQLRAALRTLIEADGEPRRWALQALCALTQSLMYPDVDAAVARSLLYPDA